MSYSEWRDAHSGQHRLLHEEAPQHHRQLPPGARESHQHCEGRGQPSGQVRDAVPFMTLVDFRVADDRFTLGLVDIEKIECYNSSDEISRFFFLASIDFIEDRVEKGLRPVLSPGHWANSNICNK